MWHYHLRGLHDDLWNVGTGECGGEVMVRILRDVICDTVAFLANRYYQIQPSYERVDQMR